MKFEKHYPIDILKPYIKYFVVSENAMEKEYKVFPSSGLVMGFQYKGQLSTIKNHKENKLKSAGITGITDSYKVFKNTTAKKFASIVRFNSILDNINETKTLTEICYENNFFDQAHFIKDFKQFTGDTPENFKRLL
ncbi:MAG: AraC family transcriptional regulator [Pedobacter sp.]|nr:MAG: AraC family transcriptional regulator [Pedobacter sp.]